MCQENHFRYPLDSNLSGAQENRGGRGTVGEEERAGDGSSQRVGSGRNGGEFTQQGLSQEKGGREQGLQSKRSESSVFQCCKVLNVFVILKLVNFAHIFGCFSRSCDFVPYKE